MKRLSICLCVVLFLLSGCAATRDDPFRVDTVVRIPVDPTDAPTETAEILPTQPPTAAPTETPTEAPTEAPAPKKSDTAAKGSSSSKSSSAKTEKPKPTEPAPTQAPTEAPLPDDFDPGAYPIGSEEYALLDALNGCRSEVGAPELSLGSRLSGIAYLRARELHTSWSHTRPDGRDYTSILSDYGYAHDVCVELLVYNTANSTPSELAQTWILSDSHRANIQNTSYTEVGVGIYRFGSTVYVACFLVG